MPWNPNLWDNGVYIGPGPSPDPYGESGPFGIHGPYVTPDPLNPGSFYRDDPSQVGGITRIDAQGNVTGSYQNTAPLTQGGSTFNIAQADPTTGAPSIFHYPTEQGGLMGLGDVWGSIAAVGLLAGIGASAGTLAAPALASTPALIGAGATVGSAGLTVASQAAQNKDLAKAGMALGLVGAGAGAVSGLTGAGAGALQGPTLTGATLDTVSGAGSLGTAAQSVAPYLSAGKTGLNILAKATGNEQLGQAAQYTGYAGSLNNAWGNFTGGTGETTLAGNPGTDQLQGGSPAGGTTPVDYQSEDYANWINSLGDPMGQGDPYGSTQSGAPINPSYDSSGGNWLSTLGTGPGGYGPLAMSGLSAIGSIIGGVKSANAAGNAAQIQANAARDANNALLQQYYQSRADLTPFREAGYQALGGLTGLTQQPFQVGQYAAQPALNPAGYAFTPPSGQQVLNDDPGYQFRLQQGQQALERSASARGTQLSGGQMKAVQGYGQDYASQEYQNAYNRLLGQNELAYGRGYQQNQDAYARNLQQFQTNYNAQMGARQQRYNELAGVAGTGQTAGTTIAGLGGNVAQGMAGNITSAGAAQAAGQVGGANAWNTALSGLGNAANSYLQQQTLNNLSQQGQGGGGNNALLTYLLASRR